MLIRQDPNVSVQSCDQPTGYVSNDDDCDDPESAANPNAIEIADLIDNDCDGDVDEDSGWVQEVMVQMC